MTPSGHSGNWTPTHIQQMDGASVATELPAQHQIVTESWNRVVAVPYIAYVPEQDRVCMAVGCDYPHQAWLLYSDDRGATWGAPSPLSPDPAVQESTGLGIGLTYLGGGRLTLWSKGRWFSSDCGATWEGPLPMPPASNGGPWHTWDPCLVDRDPATGEVTLLAETGYNWGDEGPEAMTAYQRAFIRFSTDVGRTWSTDIAVPGWFGISEVALVRAQSGDVVAACRTDMAREYAGEIDHYEGLGTCISKDDGRTWSPVIRLYDYGRHHPCMVLMPDGALVMTYVVRLGYPRDADGFPQFGVEAVVSRDHGVSWDLPQRYVLAAWSGNRIGENEWWPSSQASSTVLLPDGFLLTAYGTGYRSQPDAQGRAAPRDVGLVRWRPGVL